MSLHVPTSVIHGLETVRDRILIAVTRLRDDDTAGAVEEIEAATSALREVTQELHPAPFALEETQGPRAPQRRGSGLPDPTCVSSNAKGRT